MADTKTTYRDPVTTLRSDSYRLPTPAVPRTIEVVNDDVQAIRKTKTPVKSSRDTKARMLVKTNPWLEPILRELTDARLRMYSSDEEDKRYRSKDYGWAHTLDYLAPPESDYFAFTQNEDGDWVIEDLENAKALNALDYGIEKRPLEDYVKKPFKQSFQPMTREEANAAKQDWYPTSNELLNALIKTKLGEGNKQALYDAAQLALANAWKEDFDSETPKYAAASEHLFDDKGNAKNHYEIPNGVSSFAKNMLFPISNAVLEDPELDFKTKPVEHIVRGAGDLGLTVGSVALPWLGATRGAARMTKPLVGAAIGGGLGGLGNYGAQRLVNTGLAEATGHGYIDQPIDATDAGIEIALGALSGPLSAANKVRGRGALKDMMWPENPRGVTPKHINQSIALSKSRGSTEKAMQPFLSQAFKKFEKKHPNTQFELKLLPDPTDVPPNRADLPLMMDLPEGGFRGKQMMDSPNGSFEVKRGKDVNANKAVWPTNFGDIPMAHITPSDEFMSKYARNNPQLKSWFNSMGQDEYGLKELLKKAQVKGSPESKIFTGGSKVIPMSEHAQLLSQWRGNTLLGQEKNMRNKALRKWLKEGSEAVDMSTGSPKPLPKSQKKAYDKSMAEYKKRTNMNLVTEADLKNKSKSGFGSQVLRKGVAPLMLRATDNALPWGSSMIMGVEPFTYDYVPPKGVDEK